MRRILVVLVIVLTSGLFVTSTAQAGNWEETLLDPPPARIEPGVTYTLGYWILQHGSYPFMGSDDGTDLGPTALVATDADGDRVEFPGLATRTDGHYSAEAMFPHAGTWTLSSKHAILMTDALIATVTVPGSVRIAPSEVAERAAHQWGAIRPSFPPTAPGASMAGPLVDVPVQTTPPAVEPRSAATVEQPAAAAPWGLLALGGVAVLGLAVWLGRRHVRLNRQR
jgi:hypothetical protein